MSKSGVLKSTRIKRSFHNEGREDCACTVSVFNIFDSFSLLNCRFTLHTVVDLIGVVRI